MTTNMGVLDRGLRILVAAAAVAAGISVSAGSAGGVLLIVVAGVLLATSAAGFCPLYALVHLDTRGRRPLAD